MCGQGLGDELRHEKLIRSRWGERLPVVTIDTKPFEVGMRLYVFFLSSLTDLSLVVPSGKTSCEI